MFIVFEGIDGSGKTTQLNLLKNSLIKDNKLVKSTAEPTDGVVGKLIKSLLKNSLKSDIDIEHEQRLDYLFAIDRHDHLYNSIDGVLKLIDEGFIVISSRYYFSSFAYSKQNLVQLQELNRCFPKPDLVIFVDTPVQLALARLEKRAIKELYEYEDKLTEVSDRYKEVFKTYDGYLFVVDGSLDEQAIAKLVREEVDCCCK